MGEIVSVQSQGARISAKVGVCATVPEVYEHSAIHELFLNVIAKIVYYKTWPGLVSKLAWSQFWSQTIFVCLASNLVI